MIAPDLAPDHRPDLTGFYFIGPGGGGQVIRVSTDVVTCAYARLKEGSARIQLDCTVNLAHELMTKNHQFYASHRDFIAAMLARENKGEARADFDKIYREAYL